MGIFLFFKKSSRSEDLILPWQASKEKPGCFNVICFEVNLSFKLTALGVLVEVILEFPLGADALPQRPRYHEVGCAQDKQRQQQQDHVEKYIEHLFVYKWLARP